MHIFLRIEDRDNGIRLFEPFDASRRDEFDSLRLLHAFQQRQMHVGAMDDGVGIAEARSKSLANGEVGHLAFIERVHHQHAFGVHRSTARALADTECVECGECVWTKLDAGPDFTDFRRLLEAPSRRSLDAPAPVPRKGRRCRRRRPAQAMIEHVRSR
jgi:hypothetical protein